MAIKVLSIDEINAAVSSALKEDFGNGDITSNAIIPKDAQIKLVIVPREDIVLAGLPLAVEVFKRLAPEATFLIEIEDGDHIKSGEVIAKVQGPAVAILSGERTALNLLQTLSGIATLTHKYVNQIRETKAILLDTRKTFPGLRNLSKYASRLGGAINHRMRLDDGVLIKDNHIAVVGSASEATHLAKIAGLKNIEVECDNLSQVKEALEAGADCLLLDNMSINQLTKAVKLVAQRIPLEASGGVNLNTILEIAETGVDFISVGAITQSAPAVDIGMDLEL
jgi:nicotinate-nucleotide pyrophosphorylase (carboxylating)